MDGLFVADVRVLTEVRLRFGGVEPHRAGRRCRSGPGRTRFVAVARRLRRPDQRPDHPDRPRCGTVAPDGLRGGDPDRLDRAAGRSGPWLAVDLRCDLTPLDWRQDRSVPARTWPPHRRGSRRRWTSWSTPRRHARPRRTARSARGRARAGAELADRAGAGCAAPGRAGRCAVARGAPRSPGRAGRPVEWSRPDGARADDPRLGRLLARSLDDLESLRLTEAGAARRARSSAPARRGS